MRSVADKFQPPEGHYACSASRWTALSDAPKIPDKSINAKSEIILQVKRAKSYNNAARPLQLLYYTAAFPFHITDYIIMNIFSLDNIKR